MPSLNAPKTQFEKKVSTSDLVWVDGYYRTDGTWVAGHHRSKADEIASEDLAFTSKVIALQERKARQLLASKGIDSGKVRLSRHSTTNHIRGYWDENNVHRNLEMPTFDVVAAVAEDEESAKAKETAEEKLHQEKLAQSKLALAKKLRDAGKQDLAKKWLFEILQKYPSTDAAKEANDVLETF